MHSYLSASHHSCILTRWRKGVLKIGMLRPAKSHLTFWLTCCLSLSHMDTPSCKEDGVAVCQLYLFRKKSEEGGESK